MYTDEQIAEILELDEKRTQGEWEVKGYSSPNVKGQPTKWIHHHSSWIDNIWDGEEEADVNTQFIAKAPTMVAIIRQQQARIKELEEYEWMYKDLCK